MASFFSGKSKQQTETTPMRRDLTLAWQNRLFGLGDQPFEFFPGQTYAEMDPLQTEAMGMREQYARNMAGMVDPSMQAWQDMLSAPDVANNQYVQAMLEQQADIAGRSFREALPATESAAIAAGQFGGSRQGVAEALQERGIRETLAEQAAKTQMDAYLAGMGQQRYAMSAAPGMAQFGMMPADVLSGVGAARRTEEQKAIDEAMARHEFAQEEPWRRLERVVGTYEPMSQAYKTVTQESKYTPSAFQIGGQLAGLGMAGMGMFGGLGGGSSPFGMMPAWNALTGETYGTDPFSQQSAMLARQMMGLS